MKKRGFTLIELLVVIAIIGILATIILVAISNARPKAQRSSAVESLNRVISTANLCKDADTKNYFNFEEKTGVMYSSDGSDLDVCKSGGPATAKWTGDIAGYGVDERDGITGYGEGKSYRFKVASMGITLLDGSGTEAEDGKENGFSPILSQTSAEFDITVLKTKTASGSYIATGVK